MALDTAGDAAEVADLLVRPRTVELLLNTLRLLALAVPLAAAVGVGAAWLVERTDLPLRRTWTALLCAPLAVPAFVNGFAWVSLTPAVEGFAGAVLILTLSYYPFVFLPVAATLRGVDPALEEAARSLGSGPWATFRRVVLPQLRPAVLGGGLLVGLHLLSEFGALKLLRFATLTTGLFDQYDATFGGAAATGLSLLLALLSVLLLAGELLVRGGDRVARVRAGAGRPPLRTPLGRLTPVALLGLLALVGLALGVPLAGLVRWTATGTSASFPAGDLARTAGTTLALAAAAALVTSALALPVAWLAERRRGGRTLLLERLSFVGGSVPGIVVALALVSFSLRLVRPLYQTAGLLVLAYCVLFLSRAVVSQRAAVAQTPAVLDDVARGLGAGRLRVLRRVTLPLLAPGLGAGAALVFLAVVTELTATLLLAPTGVTTLSTEFWSNASQLAYGAAAPYAAVMVVLSAPATVLLTAAERR